MLLDERGINSALSHMALLVFKSCLVSRIGINDFHLKEFSTFSQFSDTLLGV